MQLLPPWSKWSSASKSILFLFSKTVQGRRKQKDQKPAFMVPYMNADEEARVLKCVET